MEKINDIRLYAFGSRNYQIEVEWEGGMITRIKPLTRDKAHKMMEILEGVRDEG